MPTRRQLLFTGALSAGALLNSRLTVAQASRSTTDQRYLIDGLGFPGGVSTEQGSPLTAAEVDHIASSGLSASHLTVGPVGTMPSGEAFENTVRDILRWDRECEANPGVLARVRKASDITAARESGLTGLIYGMQDGVAFEDDLDRLADLHQLGIRIIQPTYNRRNLLGDGCMEPANAGLSRSGTEAVRRMHELGILLDLSHCGRRTAADALAIQGPPVSFTHTGCDALVAHPRHRTDAELRAVAERGGVTGIFIMPYLAMGRQPTADDVIRHLEHAIEVAGEDHVGLGTDGAISPTQVTPEFIEQFREITRSRKERGIAAPHETETGYLFASDLNTPDRFARLADKLRRKGHGSDRIDKLMGGNFLRLFTDVWSD